MTMFTWLHRAIFGPPQTVTKPAVRRTVKKTTPMQRKKRAAAKGKAK